MKEASRGFTILEVLIMAAIIGIMITSFVPKMMRRSISSEWKTVLDDLNNLVTFARQQAISQQKVCRLSFKRKRDGANEIVVQQEYIDPEDPFVKKFKNIYSDYFPTKYSMSKYISIEYLYYGRENLLENPGDHGPCCYIIPDGLVQDFLIHCKRIYEGKESRSSFKMSPFLGKFDLFTGYVRPEA